MKISKAEKNKKRRPSNKNVDTEHIYEHDARAVLAFFNLHTPAINSELILAIDFRNTSQSVHRHNAPYEALRQEGPLSGPKNNQWRFHAYVKEKYKEQQKKNWSKRRQFL